MRTYAKIYLVLGIIGSIILGVMQSKIGGAGSGFISFLIYGIVIVFSSIPLFAIADIKDTVESNQQLLRELSRKIGNQSGSNSAPPPVSGSNSKLNLSALGSNTSENGTWRCPKYGKSNPTSSRVCKDCGYNK